MSILCLHTLKNLIFPISNGKPTKVKESTKRRTVTGIHLSPPFWATRQNLPLRLGGNESVLKLLIRLVDEASVRGTKIHGLCEDYINNDELNTEKITFVEEIIFNNMKTYINRIDNIHCVEQFLFSEHLRFAGQVDCIAEFDGRLSVIDFKTSAKLKKKSNIKNYFAQCAAYAIMFEERTGVPIDTTVIIIGVDGEDPQLFVEKRDNYTEYLLECRDLYEKEVLTSAA